MAAMLMYHNVKSTYRCHHSLELNRNVMWQMKAEQIEMSRNVSHAVCFRNEKAQVFKGPQVINRSYIIISGHLCHEEPQRCVYILLSLQQDGQLLGKPRPTEPVP